MIQDVIDGLKLIADGIDNIKTIAEAVKSGKEYLKANHPEVQGDLRAMVDELGKSLYVIKYASAVLTNFRFAISNDVSGSELVRFNEYFIQSKADAQLLRKHIEDLRTHCHKIRAYAERISGPQSATGFQNIFTLLGLHSPKREKELGMRLSSLANEELQFVSGAQRMQYSLERALDDVQKALGVAGSMHPENIPHACALLAEYGPHFSKVEVRAVVALDYAQELVNELE